MANDNQIDFTVRVRDDGLAKAEGAIDSLDAATKSLGTTATTAGSGLDTLTQAVGKADAGVDNLAAAEDKAAQEGTELATSATTAGKGVDGLGDSADRAAVDLEALRGEIDRKTQAIKTGLQVEQSEIELQRQHLALAQGEQQAILRTAQAKGDEAAATRASNQLRQIEGDQLALVARAKRAEATATQQAVDARREELSAIGPLSAAHARELQAAENLAKALRVEAAAADQAALRTRDLTNAAKSNASATDQMGGRVSNLTDLLGRMGGALSAAFTFREMVTAAAAMESLRSGLTAINGDAVKAGKELEFVRGVASRIGADVTEVGRAFLGLSAATRGTAVEGEPTRQAFEAVATAMGKAGKTSAETSLALQALSQMASKGTVQMEELRGQLGEALPGALQAAARGMGITTQELIKLVEEGKITASDIFPALTKGLNELYGSAPSAQTLAQEITNIKNAFVDMSSNIGEAGGLSVLKVSAEVAQAVLVGLDMTIVAVGKSIGVVAAAIATWDFSQLKQAFADIEKEAQDKLLKAAQHNETLRNRLLASGDAALVAALNQQQAATATAASGAAAAAAANDYIKLANGYGLVLTSVREQIAEQEKSVIARDAEGKASVALAQAFGTETEQRQAQAAAAAASAAEMKQLAELKMTELVVMQEELKALRDEVAQRGIVDEQKQKQLQDLEKQIGLRQQDVDKITAQARASILLAERTSAEAEATRDNSKRVEELGRAYEEKRAALERVRVAMANGEAGAGALAAAELAAGRAATLYKDAIADKLKVIQAAAAATQAGISLQEATVRLAIEQQRATMELAQARGDEGGVIRAQNEIRKMEIQLLELTAKAKRAEAQATLAAAEATRLDLATRDQLTDAKRLELEAAERSAQVKIKEAEIAEVTAKKIKDLASSYKQLGAGAGGSVPAINAVTNALGRQSDAADISRKKLQEIYDRNKVGDGSNLVGKSGDVREAAVLESDINQDIVKRYGEEMLNDPLTRQAWVLRGQLENYQKSYGNVTRSQESLNQQRNIMAELDRVEREIEAKRVKSEAERSGATQPTTATRTGGQAEPSAPTRSGGSSTGMGTGSTTVYQSNITLQDGRTRSVRFPDLDSQNTTEQLMRELVTGRGVIQ